MSEWNSPSCPFPSMSSVREIKKECLQAGITDNFPLCSETFKYSGERKINIIICQLRNSASNLNSDLFYSHLCDSPACRCGFPIEDSYHYFLYCPLYTNQRIRLSNSIAVLDVNIPLSIETFLYGYNSHVFNSNDMLLKIVQEYIRDTKRFI